MTLVQELLGPEYGLLTPDFFNSIEASHFKLPISIPYNQYLLLKPSGKVFEEKTFVVEFALAGYNKEDISVEADGAQLLINITKPESLNDDRAWIHQGIKSKDIHLSFKIVNGYDAENIKPSFKQGILKIEIPKAEGTVKKFKL